MTLLLKLLPYGPGLVRLIDDGYTFTLARPESADPQRPYRITVAKQGMFPFAYAAPTLEEAIELFVTNVAQYIQEHRV
jgi:hypothetical protein